MRAARDVWVENQPAREPATRVLIDEMAATTTMARRCGRAARGVRCKAAIPHGHGMTTSFTAGLRRDGLAAPLLLQGPIDGAAVRADIEPLRVPTLTIGDTVIMDNLPALSGASGKFERIFSAVCKRRSENPSLKRPGRPVGPE